MYSVSFACSCALISSSKPASSKYAFASNATYGYSADAIEMIPAEGKGGVSDGSSSGRGATAARCRVAARRCSRRALTVRHQVELLLRGVVRAHVGVHCARRGTPPFWVGVLKPAVLQTAGRSRLRSRPFFEARAPKHAFQTSAGCLPERSANLFVTLAPELHKYAERVRGAPARAGLTC